MYEHITEEMLEEAEQFESICSILLMSGEYLESEIESEAHYIMDHKFYYPEYF